MVQGFRGCHRLYLDLIIMSSNLSHKLWLCYLSVCKGVMTLCLCQSNQGLNMSKTKDLDFLLTLCALSQSHDETTTKPFIFLPAVCHECVMRCRKQLTFPVMKRYQFRC